MTTELTSYQFPIAALLLALFTTATVGCDASLSLGAGADGDTDTDSDIDTDADSDADAHPPEFDTDDADCDTESPAVFHLRADDSNSMAGPVVARFLINHDQQVTGAIRIQEFLNYYHFEYTPPESGAVRVGAHLGSSEDQETYDLQIGVRAVDLSASERRPLNVTLAIDTSDSMGGTPIQRVKQCCVALAASLRTGDVISMVTWDTAQNVLLQSHTAQGASDPTLIEQCNALTTNSSTELHVGLVKAYQLASLNFDPVRINRVVLISGGGANPSAADRDLISQYADDADGEAIFLMGVGVGDDAAPDHYDGSLMDTVTDAGKGSHIFIDSAQEASEMFGERLLANVEIAARDVQVELTLPPTFEMIEPDDEEHFGDPGHFEPQHLAPGDALVFHQRLESCDSSVPTLDDEVRVVVTFEDPITREPSSTELTTTLGDLLADDDATLLKGSAVVAYAEALEQLQTLEGQAALDLIEATRAQVQAAGEALDADPDLAEIDQLLDRYSQLF